MSTLRLLFKAILFLIALPVLYLSWTGLQVWQTARQDERPRSDAIVVLGAAQYDGKPSLVFKARLDHAADLYRSKVAPLVVVLGGKRQGDRFTEAQAGAAYLERFFPPDKVTGVKAGNTTLDSLRRFKAMARDRNIRSILIVSDPFHLARAEEMAQDLGFRTATSPSTIPQSVENKRSNLVQETLRLVYYRLFEEDPLSGAGNTASATYRARFSLEALRSFWRHPPSSDPGLAPRRPPGPGS